jgi:ribonuclease HI
VSASDAKADSAAHTMELYFDGGSSGKARQAYGSYLLLSPGSGRLLALRIDLGAGLTGNQAEYQALLRALEQAQVIAEKGFGGCPKVHLKVYGDSALVLRQLAGEYRVRHPGLRPLYERAKALLERFASYELIELPRSRIYSLFKH